MRLSLPVPERRSDTEWAAPPHFELADPVGGASVGGVELAAD